MSKKVENAVRSALAARTEKDELARLREENKKLRAAQVAPPPPAAPPAKAPAAADPETPDPRTAINAAIGVVRQSSDAAIARGLGRNVEIKRQHLAAFIAPSENARVLFDDDHSGGQ